MSNPTPAQHLAALDDGEPVIMTTSEAIELIVYITFDQLTAIQFHQRGNGDERSYEVRPSVG